MKRLDLNVDDLVQKYRSGLSIDNIADLLGIGRTTVVRRLRKRGVRMRGPKVYTRLSAQKILRRYRSGETIQNIARALNVSRGPIYQVLRRTDTILRTMSEAILLSNQGRTPTERRKRLVAAWAARRGQVDGPATRTKRAATRASMQLFVGAGELMLAGWLIERGLLPQTQLPVNGYNIDIAVPPVAVELYVHGGNPLSQPRLRKRTKSLLNAHWYVLYIAVPKISMLTEELADYVVTFRKSVRRNKPTPCFYRVIRSASNLIAEGGSDL